jgi:formylmethanofuran dehydrogenase subunit E
MSKNYIYKVEIFEKTQEQWITATDENDANRIAGNILDNLNCISENGDYAKVEIQECDDCGELATKMINDGEVVLCDECYEQTMFDYGYGEEIKLKGNKNE